MYTGVWERARGVLDVELVSVGGTPITLVTLLTIGTVIALTFLVSRILQSALRKFLHARGVHHEEGGAGVMGRLVHYTTIVTGFAIALQTGGIQLGALFAAGAVFAVGLGFAMQNIAQNFVSGVILLVERTIKPGDVIEVDGKMVKVMQMGIRATLVRTLDEEDVIVPNATLVTSTVKNYTLRDNLYRARVRVGVAYGSDMGHVRQVLERVGTSFAGADTSNGPRVLLVDFAASSVDWELSVWIRNPWGAQSALSQMREDLWNAFRRERITIAFPQIDVHFDSALPALAHTSPGSGPVQ